MVSGVYLDLYVYRTKRNRLGYDRSWLHSRSHIYFANSSAHFCTNRTDTVITKKTHYHGVAVPNCINVYIEQRDCQKHSKE